MDFSPDLQTAIQAARLAGRALVRRLNQPRRISLKGPRDIVTDADFAAQRAAARCLQHATPDYALLAEEGLHAARLHSSQPTWVLDPLDGTTNYAHGLPGFSVSLGLVQRGRLLAGVVHDPLRRETFCAERGRGAWLLSGRRQPQLLRVSALTSIEGAVVGVDWARDPAARRRTITLIGRTAARCRTVRALGSAALGLACVAAGRLDAYFHMALQPWDAAAGALLVLEAGGRLTSPNGKSWHLHQPAVLASNRQLHAELLKHCGMRNR